MKPYAVIAHRKYTINSTRLTEPHNQPGTRSNSFENLHSDFART